MPEPSSIASSPRRIRQRNELAVLHALHDHRRLSRADLARQLGLNRSSSGNIIAALLADGLVREVDETPQRNEARAGRPGIQLELAPEALCFLGIEIGVERISVAQIDLAAHVTRSAQVAFDGRAAGPEQAVARALELALAKMPPEDLARCEGLGIATPAQMDRNGMVRLAPLLGWRGVDLAALARPALPAHLPILVENDANAFAIGATYGREIARKGVTLLVNMESGIGGGILINGRLFHGGSGLAGELGHLRMSADHSTTLEQQIGLPRLLDTYRSRNARPAADLADLLQDVRDREPGAVVIAEDWARALAFALAQVCWIIDADTIVLGGSVAALYPLVSARVLTHLRGFQEESMPTPRILVAERPNTGAAFGAACMLHQRFLSLENARFAEADPGEESEGASNMLPY